MQLSCLIFYYSLLKLKQEIKYLVDFIFGKFFHGVGKHVCLYFYTKVSALYADNKHGENYQAAGLPLLFFENYVNLIYLERWLSIGHIDYEDMKHFIKTFLEGYDIPVLLSDKQEHIILYANSAVHQELKLSDEQLADLRLNELLDKRKVIQEQAVWEYNNKYYLVNNEEFTISDTEYVKSTLESYSQSSQVEHLDFQKEMAIRLVHRLRSPLNGILGFTELLRDGVSDRKHKEYIAAIEDGLTDLKSVLSKIHAMGEDVVVNETNVDVYQLANKTKAFFPESQQQRIKIIIDGDVDTLQTDFNILKSIIIECLQNAVQHGACEQSDIILHFSANRIRIHNEGPPIAEWLSPNVFYPFFSSKARKMGIGLAKCAYYARELDLELELAQNSEEDGVSFDIKL